MTFYLTTAACFVRYIIVPFLCHWTRNPFQFRFSIQSSVYILSDQIRPFQSDRNFIQIELSRVD